MFNIVLFEPEIPPNTGTIIRLCAVTGCQLHLIHPLGFDMDDKKLRRAGLDYHEYACVKEYPSLADFLALNQEKTIYACTTKGTINHSQAKYKAGDVLLFGPETRGLPEDVILSVPEQQRMRIPMQPKTRSLNLSNAVSIVVYEAWRQNDFQL